MLDSWRKKSKLEMSLVNSASSQKRLKIQIIPHYLNFKRMGKKGVNGEEDEYIRKKGKKKCLHTPEKKIALSLISFSSPEKPERQKRRHDMLGSRRHRDAARFSIAPAIVTQSRTVDSLQHMHNK